MKYSDPIYVQAQLKSMDPRNVDEELNMILTSL